jgi:hypothetical protein
MSSAGSNLYTVYGDMSTAYSDLSTVYIDLSMMVNSNPRILYVGTELHVYIYVHLSMHVLYLGTYIYVHLSMHVLYLGTVHMLFLRLSIHCTDYCEKHIFSSIYPALIQFGKKSLPTHPAYFPLSRCTV